MGLEANVSLKITRVMNAVAAGTTAQNSSVIDMAGFDSCLFVAAFGALTATQVSSIKVQQDSSSGMGAAADLAGSLVGPLADADGNKCLACEVIHPNKRYLRCVVNRATANAVIDGVWAIQFGPSALPAAHDSTTVKAFETWLGPAEGTA
jgi:hypothetical protein